MNSTLQSYHNWIDYLDQLREVDQAIWLKPIAEGKWSVAAIVAHIMWWDRYFLEIRLEGMIKGEQLPRSQVDAQAMNQAAEQYAHSGIAKDTLIDEAKQQRLGLIQYLTDVQLNTQFHIGERTMTICDYIIGQCEHDTHHMDQIQQFLVQTTNSH
ncbi:DinB family protein [Paenibacillus albiflavus]|nr:DinB family protein [Paenibacillus albiflavus]